MNKIHIARGSQQLGQFSPSEVAEGLKSGKFFPSDLGWQEGMQEWKPLSTFDDLHSLGGEPSSAGQEGEAFLAPGSELAAGAVQAEPAWERRGELGFFPAAFESIKQVLTNPAGTFSAMPRQGGFGNPLLYVVVLTWIGIVVSSLYQLVYAIVNPSALEESFEGISMPMFVSIFGAVILFMPLFIIVGTFINAAFMQSFLWIVGGAKQPFETTFRVLCYAQGSTAILQLIPICGGIFSTIWYFYSAAVGLAKAHETDVWRVVIALLLPLVLFCGLGIALVAVAGGAAMMHEVGG